MNRRGFLQGILIAGVMPAIVHADSLMAVTGFIVPQKQIYLPGNEILVPSILDGTRNYSVLANSMAYLEAKAEGLIEIYRSEKEVFFALERKSPSEYQPRNTKFSQYLSSFK